MLFKVYLQAFLCLALCYGWSSCGTSSSQVTPNAQNAAELQRVDSNPYLNPAKMLLQKQTNAVHDVLSKDEQAQLQNSDILLRRGYGVVSDFIANYLEEIYPVTHCGFVVRKPDSSIWILHTISKDDHSGMLLEPLADYINNSQEHTLVGIRLKGSDEKRKQVLDYAYHYLDRKMEFDMGFNDADSSQLYCAELMRNIFKKVYKKDLLTDRAESLGISVIRMSNFFNAKYFDVLFNHCDTTTKIK